MLRGVKARVKGNLGGAVVRGLVPQQWNGGNPRNHINVRPCRPGECGWGRNKKRRRKQHAST